MDETMRPLLPAAVPAVPASPCRPDEYADFAEWRSGQGAATVGDAARRFSSASLATLCEWFAPWRGIAGGER